MRVSYYYGGEGEQVTLAVIATVSAATRPARWLPTWL